MAFDLSAQSRCHYTAKARGYQGALKKRLLAGSIAFTLFTAYPADAQTYPSKAIRLIVAFPAGGGSDVMARILTPRLSERMGQPFIVDNRPGAAARSARKLPSKRRRTAIRCSSHRLPKFRSTAASIPSSPMTH